MIRVTRTMALIGRVGVCVWVRMAQGKKLVVSLEVWHLIDLSGWDARGHLWWPVGRRSWQWSPGVEEGSQWFIFFWADMYYSVNCHIITNRFHVIIMTSIKHKLIANQLRLTAVLTQSWHTKGPVNPTVSGRRSGLYPKSLFQKQQECKITAHLFNNYGHAMASNHIFEPNGFFNTDFIKKNVDIRYFCSGFTFQTLKLIDLLNTVHASSSMSNYTNTLGWLVVNCLSLFVLLWPSSHLPKQWLLVDVKLLAHLVGMWPETIKLWSSKHLTDVDRLHQ